MKNILNNKFLIIIFLFVILIFTLCTNCFSSFIFNVNDNVYVLPDVIIDEDRPLYVVYYRPSLWLLSSEPVYCLTMYKNVKDVSIGFKNGNDNKLYVLKNNYGVKTYYCKVSDPKSWKLAYTDSTEYDSYEYSLFNNILYSNSPIYEYGSDNVLFPKAPVTVEQVTIPTITQAQEIPQVMNKVLEMIIPIGLIIFGIGLLIYLVRLVILRMM